MADGVRVNEAHGCGMALIPVGRTWRAGCFAGGRALGARARRWLGAHPM